MRERGGGKNEAVIRSVLVRNVACHRLQNLRRTVPLVVEDSTKAIVFRRSVSVPFLVTEKLDGEGQYRTEYAYGGGSAKSTTAYVSHPIDGPHTC